MSMALLDNRRNRMIRRCSALAATFATTSVLCCLSSGPAAAWSRVCGYEIISPGTQEQSLGDWRCAKADWSQDQAGVLINHSEVDILKVAPTDGSASFSLGQVVGDQEESGAIVDGSHAGSKPPPLFRGTINLPRFQGAYLRLSSTRNSPALRWIPSGTVLGFTCTLSNREGTWFYARYAMALGFVRSDTIALSTRPPQPTVPTCQVNTLKPGPMLP